jgi:hypothetical protein
MAVTQAEEQCTKAIQLAEFIESDPEQLQPEVLPNASTPPPKY